MIVARQMQDRLRRGGAGKLREDQRIEAFRRAEMTVRSGIDSALVRSTGFMLWSDPRAADGRPAMRP